MKNPEDLYYTENHEWVRVEEDAYEHHIIVVEMNKPEELESLLSVDEYDDFLKEA